jgi:hypothetical protein
MREGRQVRTNTNVREPPKPSALHKNVHHGLELRDAIPAAILPPSRLQLFQADLRSETSAVQAPKSASLTPIEEFYGPRGQVRQLDHQEDEDEDEGGDAFTGDLPGYQSRSPNKHASAAPKAVKGKSASVFGSFNPLVVGVDPAQRLREEDAVMTREQSMLRPTDGSLRLQGGAGGVHAMGGTVSNPLFHSLQHRGADLRVLTSPLPPGLSSPVQSPELIEALDSVNLDAMPFEDSEDDEEGEGGLGVIAEDEDEDDEGYEDAQSSVDNNKV